MNIQAASAWRSPRLPRSPQRRHRAAAEIRRHPADVSPRKPAQHVDPRGGDLFGQRLLDADLLSNLVIYDQHKAQNSVETIVPELATSWQWSDDGKALTFKLREGVKWHDGKPFTSADVKCTFDMLAGQVAEPLPQEPAQGLVRQRRRRDAERRLRRSTFNLKRPQPALLAMLASGYSPIYACHVTAAAQRTNPIGTGPFKFVELKQNESIKLVKNPDYWKKGLPYLDGIEYTIIPNRSTAILGFVAGKFDMTFPTEVIDPAAEGREGAGAEGGLRARADQRLDQPDHQPRERAVRQCRCAPRGRAGARPQGLHRHPVRGQGRHRRRDAAAAGRRVGHAAGGAEDRARLRRRREEEPRRGAQADGEGRLRPGQAARR